MNTPLEVRIRLLPQFRWLLGGFGLASMLMAIVNAISYQNATQLIESTNRSRQTYEVIKNLVDVAANMTVAESGRRGYVYLADNQELSRYQNAKRLMNSEMEALKQQLADDPEQLHQLKKLKVLLNQRTNLLQRSIQLYQRDRSAFSTQQQITVESIRLRSNIQTVIAAMQQKEEQLLLQWIERSQANIRVRLLIELLVTCLSFALLAFVALLLYRQLLKRQEAEISQNHLMKAKEISDLKLRFFSMVSHEFRTPLSVILGSAQLLAESQAQWTDDRRLKNIHRIQSSARLMTQHLTDILTLTRAEAGKLECKPEPLDVEAFCLNLVEDLQLSEPNQQPQPNQQVLQFSSQCQCGLIKLDEKLLYSILSNLLLNAMKYSAAGSTIQLRLQCQSDSILFEVKDQGIGICSEDQPHLYQPFYRGENVAEIAGTGLGLAVVQKCVEVHGGTIEIQSIVGIGTTVSVWIPHD